MKWCSWNFVWLLCLAAKLPLLSRSCSVLVTNKPMTDKEFDYANYYMRWRGPDVTNKFSLNGWTFVHNLLHLTGSPTLQPFTDKERKVVSLFNGEIYNYKAFGEDLPSDGYALLKAYWRYGPKFTSAFDGEFAIVLFDFEKNMAILSTDVFATKPLYYGSEDNYFGVATYRSALTRLGFKSTWLMDPNTIFIINGLFPSGRLDGPGVTLQRARVKTFDLRQFKDNTADWIAAFDRAVAKRTANLHYPSFLGLSAGYDSGAVAASMCRARVAHYQVAIIAREDPKIVRERQKFALKYADHAVINLNDKQRASLKKELHKRVETWEYTWHGLAATNKAHGLCKELHEDGGGRGLSAIFDFIKKYHARVGISGIGADEIVSDYAFNGTPKSKPASAMGRMRWPSGLREVFPCRPDAYGPPLGNAESLDEDGAPPGTCGSPPCACDDPSKNAGWTNFYGNALRNFMFMTEYVGGGWGIESRYPFLDPEVVQEFLWLTPEVKNSAYKRPIRDYLAHNQYPFKEGLKTGFGAEPDPDGVIKPGNAKVTHKSGNPLPQAPDLSKVKVNAKDNYVTEVAHDGFFLFDVPGFNSAVLMAPWLILTVVVCCGLKRCRPKIRASCTRTVF